MSGLGPQASVSAATSEAAAAQPQLNVPQTSVRSNSLTEMEPMTRELQCIMEDADPDQPMASAASASVASSATVTSTSVASTGAKAKRATMVKKAIKYFEDKKNRSVSEDNLFTRRKNLAVHLGLDEKVPKKEVQKIATFCLPMPGASFDVPDPMMVAREIIVVDDEVESNVQAKDLVHYLGMRDGLTASMASQGSLSEGSRTASVSTTNTQAPLLGLPPVAAKNILAQAAISRRIK